MVLSTVLRSGRAVALAVLLGAGSFAAPALADSSPSFSFNLQLPGGSVHMGTDRPDRFRPRPVCMSDWQVERELTRSGWHRVRIGRDLGRARVEAFGNWRYRPDLYRMVVNRCTGNVSDVQRVGRPRPYWR